MTHLKQREATETERKASARCWSTWLTLEERGARWRIHSL